MKPPKNHLQTGAFPGAPRPARLLRALVGVSGMAAFLAADIGQAQTTIYSNDFSSAPVVNDTINNGNTNYAGTGVPAELNQNEWMVRAGSGTVTHDAADGNVDIVLGNNVYYLVDLTDLENDPGTETTFALSFDVESFSGNVSVFAFAGGGLDYNGRGTAQGHLFYRTYGNPTLFQSSQGATGTQVVDGTTTTITSTGRFFTAPFTLSDLDEFGDYVFIGFTGSGGDSLTIDNLTIEVPSAVPTVTVQVPDDVAAEALGDPGTIRISRGANTIGDLDVFYTLGGIADSSDYTESHTGTATIPDGSNMVDLVFTPVDDAVFEGHETLQLDLTAHAAYNLGASTTGSITITDLAFDATTMGLTIEPDGDVSLTRIDTGQVVSNALSEGWSIFKWTDGSTPNDGTRIALDTVTPIGPNEIQLESADGKFQVRVAVTAHARYLKFELLNVSNTHGGALDDDWPGHRVEFDIRADSQSDGWQLNTLLLNPMSELGTRSPHSIGDGTYFSWPYPQWAQTTDRPQPQGMVAVFGFTSDTEHDDILTDIWVAEESLPRPNRANLTSWTAADVDAWLDSYEAVVRGPWRQLSFSPTGNPQNLYTAADIAHAGRLNQIGLHNFDWQGNSQGDPSAALFPNGVPDVIAWRQYCEARGITFHLHGFGSMVQFDDPYYGRFSSHEGLARSAAGTLVNSVTSSDTTLLVAPDFEYYIGMKPGLLPHYTQPPWGTTNSGRGNTFPPYYESNTSAVRINGKLYRYIATLTPDNQWQIELDGPLSGFQMADHTAGDTVEFMVMGKSGWFAADSRSALFDQLANDYATILNHFQGNALYDGAGWTGDLGSWGLRKFSQMVYEGLDHPAGTGSSQGAGPFGNFEGRFKRIQNAGGSDVTVSMRKSKSAALALGMDDVFHNLTTVPDATDFRVRGDHSGITVEIPQSVGIWDDATAAMDLWSNMNSFLTPAQVTTIDTMEDIYVVSQTAGQWDLIRTRAMRRPGVDGVWRRMTERPDVAPRQYLKADGVALSGLENPYFSQAPEVQLHVMAAMSDSSVDNISLMPTSSGMIVNPVGGEQTLTYGSGKLIVSLDNSQSSEKYYHWDRSPPSVGHWTYASLSGTTTLDMNESRGIAITVNVPAGQSVPGGILAFATSGGFPRTYLVDIDFVGQQTFEIPHGEAANNSATWASYNANPTGLISASGYTSSLFKLYITGLPAGESTSVEVIDIKAMKEERTTGLVDPVLTLNNDSVTVAGTIPYNHYLVYPGGTTAEVYDENWNFSNSLSVTGTVLTAVSGSSTFSVTSALSPNTHLSSRIKVADTAGVITINKPVDFDSDGDGLTDLDEQPVHGTDYTVWDTDGDGFGDGYEVANGYLPTSAASTPEMQRTGHFGNGGQSFTVSFEAAFGRTYRLESCDDLETWIPLEAGIVGPGGPVTRSYPIPGVIRRFYRIVRE